MEPLDGRQPSGNNIAGGMVVAFITPQLTLQHSVEH